MSTYRSTHYIPVAPSITSEPCPKCGGTGFYCEGMLNGVPQSHTGFDCYKCRGTGWVTPKPRRQRCPKCRLLWDNIHQPHTFSMADSKSQHDVTCEGI